MRVLDTLTDELFKSDGEGRTIFYPLGVRGKGYVIPNSDKTRELRRFVKFYYVVSLSLIFVTNLTVGWIFGVVWAFPLIFWYWLGINRQLVGLATTMEKLK
jgi:hypothetical protein